MDRPVVLDGLSGESLFVRKSIDWVCEAVGTRCTTTSGEYELLGNRRRLFDGEGVRMRFFPMHCDMKCSYNTYLSVNKRGGTNKVATPQQIVRPGII